MELNDLFKDYVDVEGIEIFNLYPNTHGIEFTEKHIDEILANFERFKGQHSPAVKLSHSEQQEILKQVLKMNEIPVGEEIPAPGIVKRLYRKGQSIYADITRVPKALKDILFSGDYYRYISAEIIPNLQNKYGTFLKHIALTNNPSMVHIGNVHLSGGLHYGGCNIAQEADMPEDKKLEDVLKEHESGLMAKFSEMIKGAFKKPESDKVLTMSEVEGMISNALEKQGKELNDLKASLISKDQELKLFTEMMGKRFESEREERVNTFCEQAINSGIPMPIINRIRPILMSEVAEKTVKFSDTVDGKEVSADFKVAKILTDLINDWPGRVNFSEVTRTQLGERGVSETIMMSEIEKKAAEYVKGGMPEHEALMKARREVK